MTDRFHTHSLTISKRGIEFIKTREGLRLTAYRDAGGVWTVGYGHTGTVFAKMTITEPQAESLFRSDLFRFERSVRNAVRVPISQDEYDALISFSYNVGVKAFEASTLLQYLNGLEYGAAADQLLRWTKVKGREVKGLLNRRRDERLLFTGHYSQSR